MEATYQRIRIRTFALVLGLVACAGHSDDKLSDASTSDAASTGGGDGGNVIDDAGTDANEPGDSGGDAQQAKFALSSATLTEGAAFPKDSTCDGADTSPPFKWTKGPDGTQAYAIVLTDTTIGLVHWVIYDIAGNVFDTPAAIAESYQPAVPLGSKQAKNYAGKYVYAGPCPPTGGGNHIYEFAIYAVDIGQLPGATMATTKEDIVTLIEAHKTDLARLTGTYGR